MGLLEELASLDPGRARDAVDGAFDKCDQLEEAGVMVDALVDDFPGLAQLVVRLGERLAEELPDEALRTQAVLGGALVTLALVEHAAAEDLRRRFPGSFDPV